jgi:hypothetical protein
MEKVAVRLFSCSVKHSYTDARLLAALQLAFNEKRDLWGWL